MSGRPLQAHPRRVRVLAVVAGGAALLFLLAVAGVQVALALAPAVLLLAILAWGHYPAEELIARWARRRMRRGAAHPVRWHWGLAPRRFYFTAVVPGTPLPRPPVLRAV